jgi:hypothetical protein
MSLLLTEFTKIVRNEIPHAQYTIHNAVILIYKFNGKFKVFYAFKQHTLAKPLYVRYMEEVSRYLIK